MISQATNYRSDDWNTSIGNPKAIAASLLRNLIEFLSDDDESNAATTGARLHLVESSQQVRAETVSDRLNKIDKGLRLPRRLLADILKISHTTLYDFLKGSEGRVYGSSALDRLMVVEEGIRAVRNITQIPLGRSASLVQIDGETLIDELMKDKINIAKVRQFSAVIHQKLIKSSRVEFDPDVEFRQHNLTDDIG